MTSILLEAGIGLALAGYTIASANHADADTPGWRRLATPVLGLLAAWMLLNAVVSNSPVVTDMRVQTLQAVPGRLVLAVHGFKRPAQERCRWLQTDAYVVDPPGIHYEATLTYQGDRIKGNTRPAGLQAFGIWQVDFDQHVAPVSVEFVSRHSCGWMWRDTVTRSGPLTLGDPK